jgi:hypothetical protein
MATFSELAAQNLQGFGFAVDASEIPDHDVATYEINAVAEWIGALDDRTRMVITYAGGEVADGMWQAGFFQQFPKLYELARASDFGSMYETMRNIHTCLLHAEAQLADQPGGLAGDGSGVDSIPGAGDEGSESESEQNQY